MISSIGMNIVLQHFLIHVLRSTQVEYKSNNAPREITSQ